MQAISRENFKPSSPKVLVFRTPMGGQTPIPLKEPNQPQPQGGYRPHIHGNLAQWVAPAITLIIGIVSIWMVRSSRTADIEKTTTDEHTNGLITAKLDPEIDKLNQRVSKLEGQIEQFNEDRKRSTSLQLSGIEAQVKAARATKTLGPRDIQRLGKIVLAFSESKDSEISDAAWDALRNLLNYRSLLNVQDSPTLHEEFTVKVPRGLEVSAIIKSRMKSEGGESSVTFTYPNRLVPADQSFVYQPINDTEVLTRQGHPYLRVITAKGRPIMLLDGFRLRNVIFDGIRVEYDGGPLIMEDVYFVNCTFEINPATKGKPAASSLLFAKAVLDKVPSNLSVS